MAEHDQPPETPVTAEAVAAAEGLFGLTFTDDERSQMLEELNKKVGHYETLRSVPLENQVAPPLYFNPQLPQARALDVLRSFPVRDTAGLTRPADLENMAFWPVTHLAQMIRTRQVTSVELTEMYLARLKRFDRHLECVVTLTEDLAMRQAQQADTEIAAGHYRGPLHGIPWGAKDLLSARSYPTTWGAMPFRDQFIDQDATVVQRLTEAGAVLVAKLTLGALAYGDIWFGGKTKNPWDLSEGSSGSSAGSASATAAGLVGFSIGTETLGSIVSPSTRCGVTGLRPTFGRVSRYGAMMLSWSMDKIGPICRTVEDCALVFDTIYGPDGLDLSVTDHPFVWNPDRDHTSLRIGYVRSAFPGGGSDGAVSEAVLQALREMEAEARLTATHDARVLDVLRSQGIDLIPIDLPDYNLEPLFMILVAEAAASFDEVTRLNLDDTMQWQAPEAWPNLFRAARLIPAVEYIQANRMRTLVMQAMAAVMEQVDVFVVPSFGGNALTLTNLTGHPAVVLPHGFTERGTPTSITFIGGLYQEADVLAVAKAYQDATEFHTQHPPLHFE
ncbi:MAG: amidase [Anaerolineae bacterium]|nr:amidase [Anaerolineae bacterium]